MLGKVCNHVHNFFEGDAVSGTYTISNGALTLGFLTEGQRFRIVGSALNDGVYTWHAAGIKNDDNNAAAGLQDETFVGEIVPMKVPRDFADLAGEIAAWIAAYGNKVLSPFQSENVIGVYSYTKASAGGAAAGGTSSPTWESVFASRLNPYRKTGALL